MDPILTKFGDVTIQRLEKPKEPKPGPSAEPPVAPKPKPQFEEDETDETISLKRSFPDSQISIKKFKLDAGSVTLEKKLPPQPPQPPPPPPPKEDSQPPSRVATPKKSPSLDDLGDKQRKFEDETPFSESELSEDFDSDLEDEESESELVIPGEAPSKSMPKPNSDEEEEEEDEEDEESTSTSFLDKLVDVPFTGPPEPEEQPQKQPENSVDTDDYDFDIKEKLKEMGEISFQTVKKGEKPKKIEVSTENEVVVTPARKPGTSEEEGGAERKGLNLRRNIREVMDETKLDESTLAAQRQEAERLQRVQEQQRLLREFQRQAAQERMQHKVLSLLQGNNFSKPGTSSTTRIGNTVLVKLPNGQTKPMTKLPKRHFDMVRMQKSAGGMGRLPQGGPPFPAGPMGPHQQQMGMPPSHRNNSIRNLMAMKRHQQQVDANLTPSVSIAPVSKRFMPPMMPRPPHGSDSESDEDIKPPMMMRPMMQKPPPHKDTPVIDISSDEDCILVSEPEADQDDDAEDDPSNSGMHTHDQFNIPDDQGRVVVNIGHPDDEPDIFVAPQIARIIKPHQIGGVRFLYDNVVESRGRFTSSSGFGCILAHSMGLGKTLQVVCFSDIFLRHTPGRTILCIMPINTLQNWMAEYNMWLPTEEQLSSNPIVAQGEVRPRNFNLHVLNDSHKTLTARHKVIHAWRTGGGVLLIGYEQFRLLSLKKHPKSRRKSHLIDPPDDDKNKKLFDEVHEALVKPGPDLVICDEGHRIKNSHASISQALKQMSTKRRVVLTGYPLQNNLMEYWCMVDFVRPNYLGTKTEFCNMFERPIMNGQCIDSTETDIKLMRYRAHVLHSLLVGFVQRRSHTVLHTALPQKNEYVLLVRMTPFQRKLYETFMDVVIRADLTPNPLKAFAVCCKIWNHPDVMYYFLEKRKSRGDAIDIDLEEVAGNSAIAETAAKPKRGPGRTRKSTGKAGKNGAKPAASVTPYNSSSEVGQAPPLPSQGGAASSNPLPADSSATTPNSFSGIVSSQSQPNRTDEPSTTGPQQSDQQSFPQAQASPYSQQNPASSGGYYDQQQQQQKQQPQQQNSQQQYPTPQPSFNKPTQGTPNYDPEYNSPQSSFNQNQAPKTNFLDSFPQEASNFMENMANNTQNSNLDFINNISDNSQYHPQSQTNTNYNRDAPQNFDLNFSQNNFQNYHHQQQSWGQQQQSQQQQPSQQQQQQSQQQQQQSQQQQQQPPQQQQQQNWGQQSSQQQPQQNDQYGQQQQGEYFSNCNTPNQQYNSGFGGEPWVKKEEPKSEPPSTPMSVKSENSSDSTKPKINIISDIKLPPVFNAPDKKIKILSDIKIETKPEDLALDEKLKIEEKHELEDSLLAKKDQISSELMSTTKSACRDLKEDNGIPYDWATELLKDYVPGIIENSAKMEILFCILNESILLGDRLLVFSQSLITLDLIEQFLQASVIPDGDNQKWARNTSYYRLDGSTSALEREKLINEFNSNPKVHLFLVSTRAGSLGINLIGANRVVVLDASWNPCHDTQAVCRVYRYGQLKPCFVYRLVVDNCLEKKIYDRQINKQGMSDRVVDECNPDAHLTMKDVSTLCWDDKANEGEEKDFSHLRDNYIDVVLQKVIERHSRRFTKQPFQHESLLVDRKEKQLSSQEKRLAKKGYEREKQASRQPSYNLLTAGRGHRPVASVRPMQQDSLNARPNRWIPAEHWQRQGMTAQEMTLPLDVVIPTNQPEKGSIVLKAGQKVLVLKSPKGVYMQLESGKIVAIKTAIKVKGKAEDNHDPTANMLPKPPSNNIPPMMKVHPNQAGMPQKKIVKPFTPGVAKMNVRSVRQAVPNLVSRIQSFTKKDPVTGKVRSFQTGADAIKALQQKDHEVVPGSSSDEEHILERGKPGAHNNLDIVLPHNSNQNTAEDFSKRYSLLKKSVSIRRLPPNQQAQQQQQEQMQQLKQLEQKRISTLQQLEQATTSITDNTPFQETLDSITSGYKDDNIEDDAASMASSTDPKPAQIPSDASDQSDEVTYVSEHHPAQQSYQQQTPNVLGQQQQSSQDSIKSDVSQTGNATTDYSGYNYNYNYNQPMQPYHAPPPPPQGYGYPQQHPPPYDPMMGGYGSQPPPQYNYGYQGYHPPPPPAQYPPPPPPQANYDYNAVPPQQPMYSGYHNPYPQQYAPPPPQAMYPPPPAPTNPPTYPDTTTYQYPTMNTATSSTPYYPNA